MARRNKIVLIGWKTPDGIVNQITSPMLRDLKPHQGDIAKKRLKATRLTPKYS